MRFSFMSGMAFRIATSKKLWKKERGVAIQEKSDTYEAMLAEDKRKRASK
jgi:hypothetical protein